MAAGNLCRHSNFTPKANEIKYAKEFKERKNKNILFKIGDIVYIRNKVKKGKIDHENK